MAIVEIPSLLRDLMHRKGTITVPGNTVREVIENLEARYPGIKDRLCEGDQLRPSIAVVVDGNTSALKPRERLQESSEVHFVVSISGGNV